MKRAAAAIGILLLALSSAEAAERRTLVIASGEVSGFYYPAAGALCRILNRDKPVGSCAVMPTAGSAPNVAALKSGEADLGILQSRAAANAFSGGDGFKDGAFPELRALMSLHAESALVLTRSGTGIEQVSDLKGKRVNLGRSGSFQRFMAGAMLEAAGLSEGDLAAVVELDLADQAQELCDGNLDAAVFSGVHPLAEVAGAIDQCGAVAVPFKVKTLDLKRTPWLAKTVIKGGTYDGIKDDQPALAVRSLLVTSTRLTNEEAAALVKAIYGNFGALVRQHPVLKGLTRGESAKEGISIPLHDGAQKFFAESGALK